MSRALPSRFERIADEIASRVAPLLVDRVAAIVADRFGEVPPLLTTAGAARYLAIDEETVRRMVRRGELPALRLGEGPRAPLRFDPAELAEAFRTTNTTESD